MAPRMLAFGFPGTTELIIIAVIGLLIFGRRLPDVARSVGKSVVEFKKGLRDVKDGIEHVDTDTPVLPSDTTKSPTEPTPQAKTPDPPAPTDQPSSQPANNQSPQS